jgi:tetratricopeptide (TPR) repeat protein
VYSFALVTYQLLTGALPFNRALTPMQILAKRVIEDPLPMKDASPEISIPSDIEAAVMAALVRDKEQRTRTMREFVETFVTAAKRRDTSSQNITPEPLKSVAQPTIDILEQRTVSVARSRVDMIIATTTTRLRMKQSDILFYQRAKAFYDMAEYLSAHKDITNAINLKKKVEYYLLRINCRKLLQPGTLSYFPDKDIIDDMEEIVILDPDDYDTCFRLCQILQEEGYHEKAIRYLNKAIKAKPSSDECHYAAAVSYINLGRDELAIEALNQAIALDSTKARYYVLRAAQHVALENTEAAEVDYEKARNLDPTINDQY